MKKVGDLMNELGFRKDAPESVKKAFVESLRRSLAQQSPVSTSPAPKVTEEIPQTAAPPPRRSELKLGLGEQLSLFETEPQPKKPRAG